MLTATLVARIAVASVAAHKAKVGVAAASSWARWDSGLYMDIARQGYVLGRCGDLFPTGPYAPTDWCGNAGWFPLYPLLVRGVSALGMSPASAGRAISVVFFGAAMVLVWFGLLRRLGRPAAYALMALSAFFPGSVYYGAVFPISLAVCAGVAAIVLIDRERYGLAGLAAAMGVTAYPSMILIALLAAVPLWLYRGDGATRQQRLRRASSFVAPVALSYVAVLASFQVTTGRWNAWFLTQAHYEYGSKNPISVYLDRFHPLANLSLEHADGPAAQTAFVLVVTIAVATLAFSRWSSYSRLELLSAGYALVFWVVPLALGGQLSVYRSEALLLPGVLALRRLPNALLVPMAVGATVIAGIMDYLFFSNYLI